MPGNSLTIPKRSPHFLGDFDDFRRFRVREFLGGRAFRHSLLRLSIRFWDSKPMPTRRPFHDLHGSCRGSPLGSMSRDQYDGQQAPHAKLPHILGGPTVDDSPCLRYFQQPDGTFHRRYEALRAYFLQRRPLREIADQYGYTYDTLRQVIHQFRCQCRSGSPPLCSRPRDSDVRPGTRRLHPRPLKSLTGDAWTWNQDGGCEVALRASFSSCRCWPASTSIGSLPRPAIPARR